MSEEKSLFDRVHESIKDKRERRLSGKLNSIPFGFPRFEEEVPGIEQGKYYLISANSKVGKRFAPYNGNIILNSEFH